MPATNDWLPDDIAASKRFFRKLMKTCAELPFNDVTRTLRRAFELERRKGFYAWMEFNERLPAYIKQYLSQEVQDRLHSTRGLLASFRQAVQIAERRPENWPFWGEHDSVPLLRRRNQLTEQLNEAEPGSERADEYQRVVARLDQILAAVDKLKQTGGLAVNASELDTHSTEAGANDMVSFPICPLTGLKTNGQATTEPRGGSAQVLYSFKPIGQAMFPLPVALAIMQLHQQGNLHPRLDLAGLCRWQAEQGQPPVDISNSQFFGPPLLDVPTTFEEKSRHFLRLLYQTGGNEYKERDLFIEDDFPLAFAKDSEEFSRILKALLAQEFIAYDKPNDTPNDWPRGIRTDYYGVLLTREGMHQVDSSAIPSRLTTASQGTTTADSSTLTHLHPLIQQAAGSRFASGHYSDAIQKACTALEKAVQVKAGQPATVTGTSLMTTAFSKHNPLIQVAADPNEQLGFMNLYQGVVQALRNHYAHNLTELTDPARALEWLGFISALFYKLEEG